MWINAPFNRLTDWIKHYSKLKALDPSLSACFLVPKWNSTTNSLPAFQKLLLTSINARLLKEYPAGTLLFEAPTTCGTREAMPGTPWPVQIYYDAPGNRTPAFLASLDTPMSTMSFPCKIAGAPAHVLLDSGASLNFLDSKLRKQLNLTLLPAATTSVTFADGTSAPLSGECRFKLTLGKFSANVTALVLDGMSQCSDLILGDPFLTKHKALLNFSDGTAALSNRRRTVLIHPSEYSHAFEECDGLDTDMAQQPTASKDVELLTARETYTALQKGNKFFLAYVSIEPGPQKPKVHLYAYAHGAEKPGSVTPDSLQRILSQFKDRFEPIPPNSAVHREIDHLIPMQPGTHKPVARQYYRMTPAEEETAKKYIEEQLAKGWIRPSQSPWAAPIVFAPKPDGTLRICVDYRGLNKLTVQNSYPMPRIDMLLDRLKGSTVFSSIDLQAGYHQIKIAEQDIPKTGFRCSLGHFEYTVMV